MTGTDIREAFRKRFGREPEVLGVSPGRINLIGEHTDYNDGFVFPAAIDKGFKFAAATVEGASQVFSLQTGAGDAFHAMAVKKGDVSNWTAYPAGMAWALREHGTLPDIQAVVDSDLPLGSGVSSSAAIENAFGVIWNHLGQLQLSMQKIALLGQKCENQFVGVNSGIMDQMASAMGKAGHAMFLDTRSLEIRYAPIPADVVVAWMDTGKPRALSDSAYNERRSQCEEASRILGVYKLRDATIQELEAHRGEMDDVTFRRARHVITENGRCLAFADALDAGRKEELGKLMRASHESLRDDYEVSCRELDAMVEIAWATEGCIGARMTGAGFGGACVALLKRGTELAFQEVVEDQYRAAVGRNGSVVPCEIVDGARIVEAAAK